MASQLISIIVIAISILHPISSQVIVSGPKNNSVEQFQPVLFSCSVANYDIQTAVISWLIDDEKISYDATIDADVLDKLLGQGQSERYEAFFGVKNDVYNCDLNITSAQGADFGRDFSCAVCKRDERKCGRILVESEKAKLQVNYRPDTNVYPECQSHLPESSGSYDTLNQTTVILGQPVVLNCTSETANPPVALKWFKNDIEIEGNADKSGDFTHLNYQFTATLPDDKTSFKCTLRSDYFNVDAECGLPPVKVVSYPTVLLKSPGSLEAGKFHEFICTAASNTSSSKDFRYEWTHDRSYNEPVINTTESGSIFSIKALSTDNGDEVRCTVTDIDGMEAFAVGTIKIKSELSVGAIIGIVAGAIFVIFFIVLVVFIIINKKKSSKKSKKKKSAQPSAVPMLPSSIKPERLPADV